MKKLKSVTYEAIFVDDDGTESKKTARLDLTLLMPDQPKNISFVCQCTRSGL